MRCLGLCMFALTVSLLSGSAHAAVALTFDPPVAAPGMEVSAVTRGAALEGIRGGYLELYLAPSQRIADQVSGRGEPDDERLIRIGRLLADPAGVGRIRFTLPTLTAGAYTAVAYCEECAQGGSTFSATGRFEVAPGATLPDTGPEAMAPGLLLALSLLVAGVAVLRWRAGDQRGRLLRFVTLRR